MLAYAFADATLDIHNGIYYLNQSKIKVMERRRPLARRIEFAWNRPIMRNQFNYKEEIKG
jgi:hypothetical protein